MTPEMLDKVFKRLKNLVRCLRCKMDDIRLDIYSFTTTTSTTTTTTLNPATCFTYTITVDTPGGYNVRYWPCGEQDFFDAQWDGDTEFVVCAYEDTISVTFGIGGIGPSTIVKGIECNN